MSGENEMAKPMAYLFLILIVIVPLVMVAIHVRHKRRHHS